MVAVMDEARIDLAIIQRLFERIEGQIGPHRGTRAPPDDAPGEDIDDERDIHHPPPRRHVGEVGHPELVRPRRLEVALYQILRPVREEIRDGGADPSPPHDPSESLDAHESSDGAPCDGDLLAVELLPDLLGAVHATIGVPDAGDLRAERGIALAARRLPRRIGLARLGLVVGRWSDRQYRADRLDSVGLAMVVDERHHHRGRRSSSACAKYADALRRISLARRSS